MTSCFTFYFRSPYHVHNVPWCLSFDVLMWGYRAHKFGTFAPLAEVARAKNPAAAETVPAAIPHEAAGAEVSAEVAAVAGAAAATAAATVAVVVEVVVASVIVAAVAAAVAVAVAAPVAGEGRTVDPEVEVEAGEPEAEFAAQTTVGEEIHPEAGTARRGVMTASASRTGLKIHLRTGAETESTGAGTAGGGAVQLLRTSGVESGQTEMLPAKGPQLEGAVRTRNGGAMVIDEAALVAAASAV